MRTLLIVDDQEVFRTSLCQALRSRGFQVIEAASGGKALEATERTVPDLALIDLRMPDMDGIDLVRNLQGRPRTRALAVILLTAQARREDIAAGSTLGIRDFLLKSSFSMDDLVDRIERKLASGIPAPPTPPPSLLPRHEPIASAPRATLAGRSTTSGAPSNSQGSALSEAQSESPKSTAPRAAGSRALPAPVAEILAFATSATASLDQVQRVVRKDLILAQRILAAASGVGVKGTATIETLEDALRAMGLATLVKIVASTPILDAEALSGRNGQELSQIWIHGLATAIVTERISPARDRMTGFLDGLFHVLPALIGVQDLGERWAEVSSSARREGLSGIDAVAQAFGVSTADYSESVLQQMRLPESIGSVVREWHRDRFKRGSKLATERCRRLDAASCLASAMGFAWNDLSSIRPLGGEESRTWTDPDRLADDLPGLRKEILELQISAGLPVAHDVSVLAGLWGADETLYWRDSRFRAPDPVEMSLSGREMRRLESPELILERPHDLALACAEPGSPWWNALVGSEQPVLVLHCSPFQPATVRTGFRSLQTPVPLYLLHEALGES